MSDDEDDKPKRAPPPEAKVNDGMDVLQKRAKEVEALLAKSNGKDAVIVAIADPPLGSKNEEAKTVGEFLNKKWVQTNIITFFSKVKLQNCYKGAISGKRSRRTCRY